LRVTSFASKSRLVDRHPLYVPASAAPHVRASHYGLRLAHCSEQYDHGPKITTTDWQTRSAGDEEVTNLEARGFDGWDHRRRRALVCGCVVERSCDGHTPAPGTNRAEYELRRRNLTGPLADVRGAVSIGSHRVV